MLPQGTLKDRVAIITGGGTGIGRGIAEELARLGARVVLAGRRQETIAAAARAIEDGGGQALAVSGDVRDPAAVDGIVSAAVERFGGVDILINNAAGNFLAPAEKLSPNGWNAVVGIVLNGSFYCARAAGLRMIEQGRGGAILNNVVSYAWTGGPGTVHSAAAKAGVLAMTRTLAVEWAPYGIRVNAIAPGPVQTENAARNLWPTPEEEERLRKRVPLGRFGTVQEIAQAASYLVSDYAGYITGDVLTIDGGEWLGKGMFEYRKV